MTDQEQFEATRNKEVFDLMTTIQGNFKTITDLLKSKSMVTDIKEAYKSWLLQPFYENDRCSVGIVSIAKKDLGPCEEHIHPESIEYLIVTRGRLLANMRGHNMRMLEPGDCISIPANTPHYSIPMEDNTEMIYVTVPKDHFIPSSLFRIVENIDKAKEL